MILRSVHDWLVERGFSCPAMPTDDGEDVFWFKVDNVNDCEHCEISLDDRKGNECQLVVSMTHQGLQHGKQGHFARCAYLDLNDPDCFEELERMICRGYWAISSDTLRYA
jgi:hypothetical protein